ncbi:3287_t:CDS:2, partial [Funneliformis caledonium]
DDQQNISPAPKITAKCNQKDTICNDNTIQELTVVNESSDKGLDEELNVQKLTFF